jgi:hypothetical protein
MSDSIPPKLPLLQKVSIELQTTNGVMVMPILTTPLPLHKPTKN